MTRNELRQFFIILILIALFAIAIFFIFIFIFDYLNNNDNLGNWISGTNSINYETYKIKEPVYIIPYIGDIDGEVSEDWFFFYEKILEFHENNQIPITLSFFPASIGDDEKFNKVFLKMYESEYTELMQKGYKADRFEMEMYKLPMEGQKEIIKSGQDVFKDKMGKILNEGFGIRKFLNVFIKYEKKSVRIPTAYNQIGGVINVNTIEALEFLGFKIYFDVFIEEGFNPINSTETFDVIQYGTSFTETGYSGKETIFKTPLEITDEINTFKSEDIKVFVINGRKVIPIWAHQQDFESMNKDNKLDKEKWNIYVRTLKSLKEDPNVIFLTPEDLYDLRHNKVRL